MIKVLIDPGHEDVGNNLDPGAVGNGLYEANLTLEISKKIRDYLLDNYNNVSVKLSRTGNKKLSLSQRTNMANSWGADLFLSIHINAGGGTGYEDFIYNKLSSTSNTSRLRDIFHAENVKEQSFWRNRGKKDANFAVLRTSRMSAILTENGFIDTKADADKLKSNTYLNRIAKGHAEGIAAMFNLKKKVKPVNEKVNHNPSPTHKEAWDKATKKGIMNGKNPHNPVTREQLATILDRLGMLD